jgi:hypothetical protein
MSLVKLQAIELSLLQHEVDIVIRTIYSANFKKGES